MAKDRPVLFQTAMVHAILNNRKTMTRRTRKLGEVGDTLWVRETFAWNPDYLDGCQPLYRADGINELDDLKWKPSIFMPKRICRLRLKITSVIHERLLDITEQDVLKEGIYCLGNRINRLPNRFIINTETPVYHWLRLEDYWTTGVTLKECFDEPIFAFSALWEQINGKDSFHENPLVWVHEFSVEKV